MGHDKYEEDLNMKLGKYNRTINYIALFVLFFLQNIDNYVRERHISALGLNTIKNITLLIVGLLFLYEILQLKKITNSAWTLFFTDELKSILFLGSSFLVLSAFYMIKNGGYVLATFMGIFKIVIPVVIAYAIINVMEMQDIYKLMSILLILSFSGYLFSKIDLFSISNIKQINFATSNSPFESNFFSPTAMAFCLFFCFYRKKKSLTYLSVFFTIMTFKRIMILYAIFLLLVGGLIQKRKISSKVVYVFAVAFLVLSFFYIKLMRGECSDIVKQLIGIDVNTFVMGRAYFMQVIIRNFKSLGYMSSTVGYQSMEMDIPMIYTEMGILSVIAIIFSLLNLVKYNMYNFLIIVFCLLELLTSHWLDIPYFWIVTYITIGCITYRTDALELQKAKARIKFVW